MVLVDSHFVLKTTMWAIVYGFISFTTIFHVHTSGLLCCPIREHLYRAMFLLNISFNFVGINSDSVLVCF